MEATLKFNLPEDQKEFNRCNKATDMALVLWELVYNARKRIENVVTDKGLDSYDTIELIFKEIYEEMEERGVVIDDLIE